jgi:hypothetical protein
MTLRAPSGANVFGPVSGQDSGALWLSATGDCQLGLVNGVAAIGVSAQLLQAACTVAYGPGV